MRESLLNAIALTQFHHQSGGIPQTTSTEDVDVREEPVFNGRVVEQVTDTVA
jgi:hypothetical protein